MSREIFNLINKELERQRNNIELIASENIVSVDVLKAQGSILTNKYSEGYPYRRYYGGNEYVDEIEQHAIEKACELFGAKYANVQPHSGSQANAASYMALVEPGDTILGMDLSAGGHLTHGSPVNFSGKAYNFVSYGVSRENEQLDYDEIEDLALSTQPKLIVAGSSAYSREIDFKRFRKIADKVGAKLLVDMAHIAGLVAAGYHQNPVPYADVVTSTTHKTLRGPRGGLILTNDDELIKKINSAIFPGIQGGPLEHVIAAKAIAFEEASTNEFKEYISKVIKNAKVMAEEFSKEDSIRVISGGTDNHLFLLDVRGLVENGKIAQEMLDEFGITLNKNSIPFEELSPFKTSGVRIGTPAITSRGFNEEDCVETVRIILDILKQNSDEYSIQKRIKELTRKSVIYSDMEIY